MLLEVGLPLVGLLGLFLIFRPPKKANLRLVESATIKGREKSEEDGSKPVTKRMTGV